MKQLPNVKARILWQLSMPGVRATALSLEPPTTSIPIHMIPRLKSVRLLPGSRRKGESRKAWTSKPEGHGLIYI